MFKQISVFYIHGIELFVESGR